MKKLRMTKWGIKVEEEESKTTTTHGENDLPRKVIFMSLTFVGVTTFDLKKWRSYFIKAFG